jgi:hypothetical protein
MKVLITPNHSTDERFLQVQTTAINAMSSNTFWMASDEDHWELIAIIVPGRDNQTPMVTFAMQCSEKQEEPVVIGANQNGDPVAIESITPYGDGFLDPDYFVQIVILASQAVPYKPHPQAELAH